MANDEKTTQPNEENTKWSSSDIRRVARIFEILIAVDKRNKERQSNAVESK